MTMTTDTTPAAIAAAGVFDVRALTDEQAHAFGIAVVHMSHNLTTAKASIEALEAENADLKAGRRGGRGAWTRRAELVSRAEMTAGVLGALLLTALDRAWWLRGLAASALGVAVWACLVIAVLLLLAAEYPSAVLAAAVSLASGAAWLLVRPARQGGAR